MPLCGSSGGWQVILWHLVYKYTDSLMWQEVGESPNLRDVIKIWINADARWNEWGKFLSKRSYPNWWGKVIHTKKSSTIFVSKRVIKKSYLKTLTPLISHHLVIVRTWIVTVTNKHYKYYRVVLSSFGQTDHIILC